MIYLDYCANYKPKKEVLDFLVETELNYCGNTNSNHKEGKRSKDKYEEFNNKILEILDLQNYDIIYTSSATEANNLAIKGIVNAYSNVGKKILVSKLEHNSINGTLGYLKEKGFDVEFIDVLSNGQIDLVDLENKLSTDTILVCICLVDSELGTIQDYENISKIVSKYPNSHLLMDVTQGITKFKFDFNKIEMFSFTPHKFGGITGTGCLVKRKSTVLIPLIHGGESVSIYRSGSTPLGLIGSIYKSLELSYLKIDENYMHVSKLSKHLKEKIKSFKECVVNSFDNPYIVNISVLNLKSKDIINYFDNAFICVSQKSACSLSHTPSKIIMEVYKDKKRATSSVRISLSDLTTFNELDYFVESLRSLLYGKI